MRTRDDYVDWVSGGAALLATIVLLYFLTAPAFVVRSTRNHTPLPTIYNPVVYIFESEFRGPLVWYTKVVWGTEFLYFGVESEKTPPYVTATWALTAVALVGIAAFPFGRKIVRSRR